MRKARLWPYKFHSQGARNLQVALQDEGIDCLRIRPEGTYRPRPSHLIVNWGNSGQWPWRFPDCGEIVLNEPDRVRVAANKWDTFRVLFDARLSTPIFTNSRRCAEEWLQYHTEKDKVYCRTKLTGHSGSGIVVARTVEELVDAPLYTVGINTKGEYRVHIFRSPSGEMKVIDVQKKRRRNEAIESGDINMDIRNLLGGWVYAHNNVELESTALEQAKRAVEVLGLDFGAVDIVIEKNTNKPYVLEVNTAPGLQDSRTLAAYVSAVKEYLC